MVAPDRQIALVTGANKGIGRQVSSQLAALGLTVLLGARSAQAGELAATELRAEGCDAHAVQLDVSDADSIDSAAAWIRQRFGRLDVLVNNAGISGEFVPIVSADLDDVRVVFETNLFGVIGVTNAMLPLLLGARAPRIVNVSSSVGSLSVMSQPDGPFAQLPASASYPPSKTALNSLTVQYAKELRDTKMLVNAADPGRCATDLIKVTGLTAPRSAADGAAIIVQLATLGPDGPTGGFFSESGLVPW